MKTNYRTPLVYQTKPIAGFDLGTRTAKIIQLKQINNKSEVLGYGSANFSSSAIVEGIIVDPEEIAKSLKPLLLKAPFGHISASRVAASIPVSKVFTRILELPPMSTSDLGAAVQLEAEQYIPVPLPDLYIDYEIVEQSSEQLKILMVAAPRAIVDSYIKLFEILELEVLFIESSLSAVTRAIISSSSPSQTTLIADMGSKSTDVTIFDKAIRLTDTISVGGDDLTEKLVSDLEITNEQANEIKYKFGLGPSGLQRKMQETLRLPLMTISDEIKRVIKYYQDRNTNQQPISSIVISGGSANMPGLVDILTSSIGLPVTIVDPWSGLELKNIPTASKNDAPMYTTAIGLARLEGKI